MLSRLITRTVILAVCLFGLGPVRAVAQSGEQIDWKRAQELHQKFLRGEKLSDEERAYHDRAAKAIQAKTGQQPDDGGIDWNRAQQIHQKFVRGEKLTAEEQAYHDRAAKVLRARAQQENQPPPAKPPVGLTPLTDMTAKDRYKGQDGGLYGNGQNEPPEKHREAAMKQARLIQPLDAQGKPAADGKIVLISVGMSNTTQEFSNFVRLANADPDKSPQVVIVDGAQGSMTANVWADPGARNPWEVLDQRLRQAGVSARQVQAAWIKQALPGPEYLGAFPKHADVLKGHVVGLLRQLNQRFPNVRIAYLSSRIYAGYATTHLNPEPYAYESAFVVRGLIQDQINGASGAAPRRFCSGGLTFGPMARKDGRSTIWSGRPKTWGRTARIPATTDGGKWPSRCCDS